MIKPLLSGLILVSLCACAKQSDPNNYTCGEDSTVSIADISEDEAELLFKEQSFVLNRQVSASGVKYSNDTVLFWSKGAEAMFILKGKKYHCALNQP
tara:strand:- start:1670 stop:1960 length:291 start_codon:yes stop_codon:yes gene_type:complete